MKKETFADKLAKKSFESPKIQKSWQAHVKVFGTILEPAFMDDYKARLHLTAALNAISNRKLKDGFKELQLVEKACVTDADKAAYYFCMGIGFEMANMKEDMVACYQEAGEYGHSFYLPYLKVAKAAHNDAVYEVAEENYVQAIQCLQNAKNDEQMKNVLGSAYTNYTSCLTMMHRYEAADEALKMSYATLEEQMGRLATEAILEAAKGNDNNAKKIVERIKLQEPMFYEQTNTMVNDILNKVHPHFSVIDVSEDEIKAFWDWFMENESILLSHLGAEYYDDVFQVFQERLKKVFPYMERDLELGIEPRDGFYQITFADFFVISLEKGYKKLIYARPQSLAEHWGFEIAH